MAPAYCQVVRLAKQSISTCALKIDKVPKGVVQDNPRLTVAG
jgi:hypothetical protein